jgi:hypothetical protein
MRNQPSVNIDLEILEKSSRAELRAVWERELGDKPPLTLGRDILALAISYARQERLYGGLSRPVAKELDRLFAYTLRDGAEGMAGQANKPILERRASQTQERHAEAIDIDGSLQLIHGEPCFPLARGRCLPTDRRSFAMSVETAP